MKSFKELDAIVGVCLAAKLPKEHTLFMGTKEKIETDVWLRELSGTLESKFPNSDIKCDTLRYAGFTFYLVDTGYADEEPHYHDWVESKTYIMDTDYYILSRYCADCKKTETYHGKEKRWIETGYIKKCIDGQL